MEEINNLCSIEKVQDTQFDYSDVTLKEKEKLIKIKIKKGLLIQKNIIDIGRDLIQAQEIYARHKTGKFTKWVEYEYGMPIATAKRYIQAYNVLAQREYLALRRAKKT